MAASALNTTTVQYPIWIEDDKIHCDEDGLKHHMASNLDYNENAAIGTARQISEHMNLSLEYFWSATAEFMNTEALRVILQTIKHSQLIYLISYQGGVWSRTALYYCAVYERSDVIAVILDCCVSEEECYQLLSSITDLQERLTPLHISCTRGDTESVRVILNHVNQNMRYSLLGMANVRSNTPLHNASYRCQTDVMKVIHESVTQTQWINLLQMKGYGEITVLQKAAYDDEQSLIDTIRNSVSDEEWLQLLSTPLPAYSPMIHNYEENYQRADRWIDEMRAAAKVRSVLQIENHSGMLSSCMKRSSQTHVYSEIQLTMVTPSLLITTSQISKLADNLKFQV